MKKIITSNTVFSICLFTVAFTVVLAACRKDKGNYTYTTLDELTIANISDTVRVQLGTTPSIMPALSYTNGKVFNDTSYTYQWVTYNNYATYSTDSRKIIATTKNLDTMPTLGLGTYSSYFVVTEKSTGVQAQKHFILIVSGTIKKAGWFVLSAVDTLPRLDYYEEDQTTWGTFPTIYRDLTSSIADNAIQGNTMKLSGKPLYLESFTNRDPINTATNKSWLYIGTNQSTQKINVSDGFLWNSSKYSLNSEMAFGNAFVPSQLLASSAYSSYAYANDNLYLYNFTTQSLYGTPVNRVTGGSRFNISPSIIVPIPNTGMHCMFYDTDNKRFARTISSSTTATLITTTGQPFDMGNVGMDMVWMGYTRVFSGQVVAIFKDVNAKYYLVRIRYSLSGTNATITAISKEDITTTLTNISSAQFFTMDQQYGYLFYSSGSKLYQYDMDAKVVKEVQDYGSRKISLLKVNRVITAYPGSTGFTANTARWTTPNYAIIVATYDEANPSTSGQIDFFNAPALLGSITKYQPSFTGFGKVADVKYNELSN